MRMNCTKVEPRLNYVRTPDNACSLRQSLQSAYAQDSVHVTAFNGDLYELYIFGTSQMELIIIRMSSDGRTVLMGKVIELGKRLGRYLDHKLDYETIVQSIII